MDVCPPFLATSFTYSIHEAHGHKFRWAHKVVDFSETQSEYRINIFYLSRWCPDSLERLCFQFNPERWMQKEGKDIPRNPGNQEAIISFLIHVISLCCFSVTQSWPVLCDPMGCIHQAPLSMAFSRQEYWSGLPFPSPFSFVSQLLILIMMI